jgi:hypothetical protein
LFFKALLTLAKLSFLSVLFYGCGVKTHPYPEITTLPAKVTDLVMSQDDKGYLTVSWRAPELNMAGGPLRELSHFEIWEASYPIEDFCEGCPSTYRKAGEAALAPPPPGLSINPKPYYWTEKLKEGMVYRVRVAGFSGRGGVHPQAWSEITAWAFSPPGELKGLRAETDDLSVRLTFDKPLPGEKAEIWRRTIGSDASPDASSWEPMILTEETEYLDLRVAYENTYAYRGRKTILRGESLTPGPYSNPIFVKVEDKVPLRPIAYLDASLTPEGALLNWESLAAEPGFKAYRVYRRLASEDKFTPIGGLVTENSYLDKEVPLNEDVRYRVTSLDDSPNANESLASPEASLFSEEEPTPFKRPDL